MDAGNKYLSKNRLDAKNYELSSKIEVEHLL
jgi:hypothetical protein